ncbi:MAG: amidohydrolase family protein [Gemmatimonadetes bacterium]|nr:amidohydrolase family protein [Gemmatimonadota bacterium]
MIRLPLVTAAAVAVAVTSSEVPRLAAPAVISSEAPAARGIGRSHGRPAPPPRALAQVPCPADLVIRNGAVLDGTGTPAISADVAISAARITAVSRTPLPAGCGRAEIDARHLTVAPGFIDLHAHIEPLAAMPDAASEVRQGVTLALGGPDGGGPSPFGTFLDSMARLPLGMNVAWLTGHNRIRTRVMGTADRAPTAAELAQMVTMVREAMHDGAFGLSTGLRYVPGYYSTVDEVVALAQAAADSGGIYTSHLREEGLGLLDGVAEALEIGRRAHVPVVLTHHKAIGREMWGRSTVTLHMADSARRAGTDVMQDQYPYTASSTALAVLIPPWALAGGRAELAKRAANPALRDSIVRGIADLLEHDRGGGDIRRVQFAGVGWQRDLEGKTLFDWAKQRGVATTAQAAAPLVLEGELRGGASMVYHIMDEADVRRIMRDPFTAIASDGSLTRPGIGVPHPRSYGTFPRVLGTYVREAHVLTLPEAVRKMTSLPAKRLGLADRGCLRAGCAADVTVFDPATVGHGGTFEQPHVYPTGIQYVIVNGGVVVSRGEMTAARPGRVLRRPRSS